MTTPIASTLAPLTDEQVAAYRRLPGSFGAMLQVCFNDGWNGCHAHMAGEIARLDERVAELEASNDHLRAIVDSRFEVQDRYRAALERIRDRDVLFDESMSVIAREALEGKP